MEKKNDCSVGHPLNMPLGCFPQDPAPPSVSRCVAFLEKTDARDKLVKAIQNFLKFLVWRYAQMGQKEMSKFYKAIASTLSEYRSILKFGKQFKMIRDIREIGRPGDIGAALEISTNVFDIGYKLYDNIEFLSKYKVLAYNADNMESISKAFQFWTYLTQFVLDLVEWRKIKAKGKGDEKEKEKKMQKLRLELVKDTSDLLRVLPPYLRRYSAFPTHDGFAGLMGAIAGLSGSYAVWLKTPK